MTCVTFLCNNPMENRETGLCASCGYRARKAQKQALAEPKKRKAIKPRSDKREAQEKVYNDLVRIWKKGKKCGVRGCVSDCQDAHHQLGREGDLLLNTKYWFPICRDHHTFYTQHSALAIAHGYSLPRNSNIDQTDL